MSLVVCEQEAMLWKADKILRCLRVQGLSLSVYIPWSQISRYKAKYQAERMCRTNEACHISCHRRIHKVIQATGLQGQNLARARTSRSEPDVRRMLLIITGGCLDCRIAGRHKPTCTSKRMWYIAKKKMSRRYEG